MQFICSQVLKEVKQKNFSLPSKVLTFIATLAFPPPPIPAESRRSLTTVQLSTCFSPAVKLNDTPRLVDRSTVRNTWNYTAILQHVLLQSGEEICNKFWIFTAVVITTTILRIVTPCSHGYIPNFVGICCLHLRSRGLLSPAMYVLIYRITRHYVHHGCN